MSDNEKILLTGKTSKKQGFTLVELLVVVAIIGIMATMIFVSLTGTQARSRDAQRKKDLIIVAGALDMYYKDNQAYPVSGGTPPIYIYSNISILDTILVPTNYIAALPIDPKPSSGNEYQYKSDGIQYKLIATKPETMVDVTGDCISSDSLALKRAGEFCDPGGSSRFQVSSSITAKGWVN